MAEGKLLDEILAAHDLHDRVYKLAQSWGASEELAEVFATSQKQKFQWDGVRLSFNGVNAVDNADTKSHFTEGALKPLFPAVQIVRKPVDTSSEERQAFERGSVQARGELVRKLGEAAADARAQAWGLDRITDFKSKAVRPTAENSEVEKPAATEEQQKPVSTNPWSKEAWDTRRQFSVIRAMGPQKASELAHAAGSFLGATRPDSVNMTSTRRSA